MLSKKAFSLILITGLLFQTLPLHALDGVEFERVSMVYTISSLEIKERPGFSKATLALVSSESRMKVLSNEVRFNGTTWIKVEFGDIIGWIDASNLVKEEYYSMQDSTKTVFVRERQYLASTTQDICSTSTPSNISNVVTNFRETRAGFVYTPSETIRTNVTETPSTNNNGSTTTDFRTKIPLFKYVVNESVKETEETPLLSTVTGFVTTSFRKLAGVFSYTPLEVVRDTVDTEVESTNTTTITDFRGAPKQYTYTPLEVVRDTVDTEVESTNTTTITDFRGAPKQYVYSPAEFTPSYSCVQTK